MSEISVVVVGSTSVNSTVGNGDTVNVSIGSGGEGGGAVTIQPGTVTTVDATQTASIVNVGTALAQKWNFSIPRGAPGLAGPANSLSIASVSEGTAATVSISGEAPSQQLSFVLPPGPANSLSVGAVSTGVSAAVSITGAAPSQQLSFVIPLGPEGPPGPVATLQIGSVTSGGEAAASITGEGATQTLNLVLPQGASGGVGPQGPAGPPTSLAIASVSSGTAAAVSISGEPPSQQLSFVLPVGPQGAPGPFTTIQAGSVTTGAAGTQAKVEAVSVGGTTTLNFTIPRGVDGTANLADEAPQPLGVAYAGVAGFAARGDHVHPLQIVSYTALANVPLQFPPEEHTQSIASVTGLQAALDAKQPVGNYAPLDGGNKVPSAYLPSYVDDVSEYENLAGFPVTGEVGKIFVARDTNRTYRWSGSAYIEISASPGSTDAVPEGSANLYYTDARAAAAAPIQSLNGLTGALSLVAGQNIGITAAGAAVTIAATGGGIGEDDPVDGGDYVGVQDIGIQISAQPQGGATTAGTAFAMSVTASYLSAISYQWQRRVLSQNSNVIGSPQWVASVDRTTASTSWTEVAYGSYEYRCVLSAPGTSSVTSSVAAVTVDPEDVIAITQQPDASVPEAGYYQQSHESALTLSVAASYPLPISYQWQYRLTTNSSFVPYPVGYYPFVDAEGATTASFAFSAPDYPYEYEYRCVLTADSTPPVIGNSVRVRWL